MADLSQIRNQTIAFRRQIARLLGDLAPQAASIPAGWRNHPWWHAGHLVVTPRLLTHGLRGAADLGVPAAYRSLFAKGTSPQEWPADGVPAYAGLLDEVVGLSERLFDELAGAEEVPFARPYTTSVGVVLETPAQALSFSLAHDGIHLGLLLAMTRALTGR